MENKNCFAANELVRFVGELSDCDGGDIVAWGTSGVVIGLDKSGDPFVRFALPPPYEKTLFNVRKEALTRKSEPLEIGDFIEGTSGPGRGTRGEIIGFDVDKDLVIRVSTTSDLCRTGPLCVIDKKAARRIDKPSDIEVEDEEDLRLFR